MLIWLLVAGATLAQAPDGQTPPPDPAIPKPMRVATMSELMVKIIYPTSDAVFYITTRTPKDEVAWNDLQSKTLMLAETGNLMLLPIYARDQDRWMKDAKLMLDAGTAAFKAAKAKDLPAIEALNDKLYESCVTCHQHYRANYGRRP